MKWLKHMNDSSDDPQMVAAIEEQGLVVYAVYWKILEEVAKHYKPSLGMAPAWSHTLAGWARICHLSTRKFRRFAESLASKNLIQFTEVSQNSFETSSKLFQNNFLKFQIYVPNMLKFHDEYAKNSEVTSETHARAKKPEVRREEEYTVNGRSSVSGEVLLHPASPPPPNASRVEEAAAAIPNPEIKKPAEPKPAEPPREDPTPAFAARCQKLQIAAPSPAIAKELHARYPQLTPAEAAAQYPRFPGQQSPGLWRSKTTLECSQELQRQQQAERKPQTTAQVYVQSWQDMTPEERERAEREANAAWPELERKLKAIAATA